MPVEKPITEMVKKYMDDNLGYIDEDDCVSAIALLATMNHPKHTEDPCTETHGQDADLICGARSLVENALAEIHK